MKWGNKSMYSPARGQKSGKKIISNNLYYSNIPQCSVIPKQSTN